MFVLITYTIDGMLIIHLMSNNGNEYCVSETWCVYPVELLQGLSSTPLPITAFLASVGGCIFLCLSLYEHIYLSINLFIYLSIGLSVYLSIYLSSCPPTFVIDLFIHLIYNSFLPVYTSIYVIFIPIYISIYFRMNILLTF